MRRSARDARRVSAGAALAAGLAGWLALAFAGTAYPSDKAPESEEQAAARLLSNRAPLAAADRLAEARAILAEERRRRIWDNVKSASELATGAAGGLSPSRALKSARRVARDAREWFRRSPGEDMALALLDPAVAAGEEDAELVRAWDALNAPEAEQRYAHALDEAADALEDGDVTRARRATERARRLVPTSIPVAVLLAEIALAEIAPPRRDAYAGSIAGSNHSDALLAGALLAERYDRALLLEGESRDSGLARSAALLLSGRRDEGLESLRELAEADDPTAEIARGWLDDPTIDPEGAFLREQRSFRVRTALGWIGGDELERHGLETSRKGVRSWSRSLTPFNLALSFPARMVLGRAAASGGLREAAERYLELAPDGPRADDARDWLSELDPGAETPDGAAWDDGMLLLPRASARYAPVAARPLLLSQAALERASGDNGDLIGLLRPETPALVLAPLAPPGAAAVPLDASRALDLLASVARGFEEGALRSASLDAATGAEAVRRLAGTVRDGRSLVAYATSPRRQSVVESFEHAVVGAAPDESAERAVDFEPGRRGLAFHGDLTNGRLPCPDDLLCVDRHHPLTSRAFAEVESDGEILFGATASFGRGALTLSVSDAGPAAAVSLPLMHWIGLGRWLPLGLSVGVGLDGGSFGVSVFDEPEPAQQRPY